MTDLEQLRENLRRKGYSVELFPGRREAAAFIDARVDGRTVGIGGSETIRELKLFALLAGHNRVYWHEEPPAGMTAMEARRAASRAEVYLSSVNGISLQGEIVNLDNTGNRVAAISFGPREVYLVIGRNKVAADLAAAVDRARNTAAPQNAGRLKRSTPCAALGDRCLGCRSPEKICRILSVLLEKPAGADYRVVLIDEDLGY